MHRFSAAVKVHQLFIKPFSACNESDKGRPIDKPDEAKALIDRSKLIDKLIDINMIIDRSTRSIDIDIYLVRTYISVIVLRRTTGARTAEQQPSPAKLLVHRAPLARCPPHPAHRGRRTCLRDPTDFED